MTPADSSRAAWRASSHSGANGDCVQVAADAPDLVEVRDSKNRSGPVLAVTAAKWRTFIASVNDQASL